MNRPTWRDAAACAAAVRRAKQICGRCGVRAGCLADALRRDERHGVWGGLTELKRYLLSCPSTVSAGSARLVNESALVAAFANAGPPDRPVAVIRAAFDVAASTAYKTLARAQTLGLVERRPDGWYPVAR